MDFFQKSEREKIIFNIKQQVKKLLERQNAKKNLKNLRHARYMKEDYSKRKKRFNLTFNQSDFKAISKEAKKTGLTLTAFLRDSVFSYLKNQSIPSKEKEEEFSEMVFLLRNMGNNLNQIAKQANTVQKLSLSGLVKTRKTLQKIESTAKDFIKEF